MKKTSTAVVIFVLFILGYGSYKIAAIEARNPQKSAFVKESSAQPCFLLLSDVHLNTFAKGTQYGDDTGMDLWNSLKAKLKSILNGANPPQFIIYTGDLPAHYNCSGGCYLPPGERAVHNKNLATILNDLRELAAQNHTPLLYAPGNNDALAGDYYSFADSAHKTPLSLVQEATDPYPALNVSPIGNNAPCMVSDAHPEMGYFAACPIKGLRVIALNTIIWGPGYDEVDGISQSDAGNTEMDWLAAQLGDAAAKGEKVYLAMHIPPGTDAYAYDHQKSYTGMWAALPNAQNQWLNQFLRLTNKYSHTITGIFYGHTHMDELRRIYDSTNGHITEVAISCPGITPQHYNNPGFKLVYYDAETTAPMDFVTHYSTPTATTWADSSYRFSVVFHAKKGQSIRDCVASQALDSINTEMDAIYTVKNGQSGYGTQPGIEVKSIH